MNNKKNKPKTGLSRCMELASDKKGWVFLSVMLSSLAAIASFIPYLAIYGIMRELIQLYPDFTGMNVSEIMTYAWIAMGGIAANILLYFCALFCSHWAAFGTLYELKLYFARHLTKIPLGYHFTIGSGRMRKIMDENIESIEGFIAHQLPDFVASMTAPIVMVVTLLIIDWRFGILSMLGIVLAFAVQFMGYGGSAMKANMQNYQRALEAMSSASVEYVRGMSVVKAFDQSVGSFEKLKSAIEQYVQFAISFSMGFKNCMPAFTTIVNNLYLLLLPLGIYLGSTTHDYLSFATTFIFYLIFVPSAAGILNKIMYVSESFMQVNGDVERMDEILSIKENSETSHPKPIHDDSVTFSHVSFAYDQQSVFALDDISFTAPVGKLTAIVGASGGGKSTIASLICRFYDVDQGKILIGDTDIRDIASETLMNTISFVFQDTFLFKTTIKENIRYGNPQADDEAVIEAAKRAQCHEFIMKLPQGYDTVIGAQGIHLSGGERQRITIARAMIKNAPILVLDEASAFCDPENEALIQKAFEALMKEKTVIMIAHRLSTIRKADQILVLEKGKLVEQGTHETLCQKQGRYASMWDHYTRSLTWKLQTKQEEC